MKKLNDELKNIITDECNFAISTNGSLLTFSFFKSELKIISMLEYIIKDIIYCCCDDDLELLTEDVIFNFIIFDEGLYELFKDIDVFSK